MAKKTVDINKIIKAINEGFKSPVAAPLSKGIRSDIKRVIPTGIEAVDRYVTGVGGLPCGRMVELFADEGIGKTSFALSCIAGAQRSGAVTFLAETECALEAPRSKAFGVDWDRLISLEPGHWGEVQAQVGASMDALPRGVPALFVLDSVAATRSKEEVEEGLNEPKKGYDRRAAAISVFMRKLGPVAAEKQVAFLFVNQVRANIGVLFGPDTITPGGYAMKFHSSIRFCMYPGKSIKGKASQHLGKYISIQAVKNKFTPPWRKTKLKLDFATGFDDEWSTLNHAKELKLITPRSRDYTQAKEALEASNWIGGLSTVPDEDDEFAEG